MVAESEVWRTELGRQLRVLHAVVEGLPEGVVVVDENGKFLLFNEAAENILGLGGLDVRPARWSEAYGCYELDGVTPLPSERLPLARALRGECVREQELFIRNARRPDGVRIVVSGVPLRNEAGSPCGAVVLFRDVTESSKATETIQLLSNAVEQTADSVMITDSSGAITYVNPAFEITTGYSRAEVLGKNPSILRSDEHDAAFFEELWDTILEGQPFRTTIVNRTKSGKRYWAEQTITPMKDRHGRITHFVSLLKDVTHHRKLQQQEVQMQLAEAIQRRFYVVEAGLPGFDIAGKAFPANQTGGDYFDFVPFADGSLGIGIGDVTGHGFGSALLMTEMRTCVRLLATQETAVGTILARANEMLFRDLDDSRLITLLLVRLDPTTHSYDYASAGHVPGYVLDRSGRIERELSATGLPLGLFRDATYQVSEPLPLDSGRVMALVTDGITEAAAPDDRELGPGGLLNGLREHIHQGAAEIVDALYEIATSHRQGRSQDDDVTLVVCKSRV